MRCPECGNEKSDCIDSRREALRRRRYKCVCGNRFSTVELYAEKPYPFTKEEITHLANSGLNGYKDVLEKFDVFLGSIVKNDCGDITLVSFNRFIKTLLEINEKVNG